jgi:adenosylmethionine-8-amino-7-oxononanoate aminotransferase
MEFVADRAQKTPFDPEFGLHRKIKAAAFEAGLLCYPMGGTIDGKNGDHLLLAPPFILEDSHIGEITDKLAIAFDAVMPPA